MEKNVYLLDADYVDHEMKIDGEERKVAVIRLSGKTEDGKTVLAIDTNFDPYFYAVPQKKFSQVKKKMQGFEKNGVRVKKVEEVEKILAKEGKKEKALKIYGYHPSDLPKIRDKLKELEEVGEGNCYEFGINFYKRYLIDKQIKPMGWIEVEGEKVKDSNFDLKLEVKDVKPMDADEQPDVNELAFDLESYEGEKRKIIMLSLAAPGFKKVLTYEGDDYGKEVEILENEKKLIQRFLEIVEERDPDFLITYNGDEFDFKLLRERAEENNVELTLGRDGSRMKFVRRGRISSARIPGRVHIDLYDFVDHLLSRQLETEVLTLDAVASELLGEEKIELELEEILQKWREKEDLGKLAEYCLRDSELTLKLADQLLPQINELSRITGQLPFDCTRLTYGQLVEWYLLRKSYPERIAPSRPKWKEIQSRRKQSPFKGGFVKEPVPGIHEGITTLDFQSLYPTIIASYNISPERRNCDCCEDEEQIPGMDYWFCTKEDGFIPKLLEGLIQERTEVKEKMRKVKKDSQEFRNLNNRQYALKILANSHYGYFGYVGARWYSRECAQAITSLGRKWIKKVMEMAEEESFEVIYGDTDSLMIKNGESDKFLQEVNSTLPGIMKLELEGKFTRGIFVRKERGKGAKKRYALADPEGNLKIRGFETVRRDWCALAKRVQRKILRMVLAENKTGQAVGYAKDVIGKLEEKDVDLKDLIIYTQLTKPIEEYESVGPHVEAAKQMKERGEGVGPGSVIMYVITQGSGSISERAMPFQFADLDQVDSDYYINHQIVPAALRVLEVLGVDKKQLLGKGKQESLGEFS